MDITRFTYVGAPAYAHVLAQELEAQGLSVDYQPPMERKDLASAMNIVAVIFAVTGPVPLGDIISSIRTFTNRTGTRVDGLPDTPKSLSPQERLAQLDALKAAGAINTAEHAIQRARILGEL